MPQYAFFIPSWNFFERKDFIIFVHFSPTYMRHIPAERALWLTFLKPAAVIMFMNSVFFGK